MCVVKLKLAEVYVTILFTPIVQNYNVTFYVKFKNLKIDKIFYIICALLLLNYSIMTQFI